ncbi:MAG: permease-like cell division protein FtsX [Peptostreptococcaceae bacterium]|nr:permease-like cell division protein FtsX [Peptostreptococcaceae bacterium]MDY5739357.1 permease-like cell division protein FtsX [Anaerovoracaceae bacterium]
MINRLKYNIRQALQQIKRNRGMSFTSVLAITAMMLILGLFFVVAVNINLFTEMIKQDYDFVEVYIQDDVSKEDAKAIMDKLEDFRGVKTVDYRSKEDALSIMKQRWGNSGYLLDSLGNNPLPNSILINVKDNEVAGKITGYASELEGVEDVKYYKETVDKLTRATNFIQTAAVVIMAFLIIVSVVVVSNTIKLTVLARAKEISIMKYIGATSWFVRGPFLIEGIILGAVASFAAAGLTWAIYAKAVDFFGTRVMTLLSSPLVPPGYMAMNLIIIFLAIGISVGACGSIVSMRKFLDK